MTLHLPRKASTSPAMPFMALRKIWGRAFKQGCWHGSTTESFVIAYCKNSGVWLMTEGLQRLTGLPKQWRNLYQDCTIQSAVASTGMSWTSSSPINYIIK